MFENNCKSQALRFCFLIFKCLMCNNYYCLSMFVVIAVKFIAIAFMTAFTLLQFNDGKSR